MKGQRSLKAAVGTLMTKLDTGDRAQRHVLKRDRHWYRIRPHLMRIYSISFSLTFKTYQRNGGCCARYP